MHEASEEMLSARPNRAYELRMNNLHKKRLTVGLNVDGAIIVTPRERRRMERRLQEAYVKQSRRSVSEDTQATAANLDELSDDQGRSFLEYDEVEKLFPRAKEKPNNIPATGDGEDGDINMIHAGAELNTAIKNSGSGVRKARKNVLLKALSGNQRSKRAGSQQLASSGPHLSVNDNPCQRSWGGLPPKRPIKKTDTVLRRSKTGEKPTAQWKVPHSKEAEVNDKLMEDGQKKVNPADFTDLDGEIEPTMSVSLAGFMRGDSSMATDNFRITDLVPLQSMQSKFSVSIQAPVNLQEPSTATRIISKEDIEDADVGYYEELVGLEPECCAVETGHLETVKPTTQDTCCELDLGRSIICSPPQTNVSATERIDLQPPDDSSISTEVRKKGTVWRFCGGMAFLLGLCTIRGRRKRWSKQQGNRGIVKQIQPPTYTTPSHQQEQPIADSEYSNPMLPSPMVIPPSPKPSEESVLQDADRKTITYSEHSSDGTLSQIKLIESGAYLTTTRSAYNSMTRQPVSTTKSTQKKLNEQEQSSVNLEKSTLTGQPSADIKVPLECDLMPDEEIKKMRQPKVLDSPYQQTDTFSFSEMGSGYGSPDFEQQAPLPEALTTDDSRTYSLPVSDRPTTDINEQAERAEDAKCTTSVTHEAFKVREGSISEASVAGRWTLLSEVTPCYAQMHFSEHSAIGLGDIAQTANPLQRIGLVCRDQGSTLQTNCCNGEGNLGRGQVLTGGGLWIDWSAIRRYRKKARSRTEAELAGTEKSSGDECEDDLVENFSEVKEEEKLASLPFSGLFRAKIVHHGRANFYYATSRPQTKETLTALALSVPPGPAVEESQTEQDQTGDNVAKVTWQQIRRRAQTVRNGERKNVSRYVPFVESASAQTVSSEHHAESSPNIFCEVSYGGDQTSLGISSGFESPTLHKTASFSQKQSRPSTVVKASRDKICERSCGCQLDSSRVAAVPKAKYCHTGVTQVVLDDDDDYTCVGRTDHSEYRREGIRKFWTSKGLKGASKTEMNMLDELKSVLSQTNNNNSVVCGNSDDATMGKVVQVESIDNSQRISAQDYALPGMPEKPPSLLAQLREARELGIGPPSLPTPSYFWEHVADTENRNPSNSVLTGPRRKKNKAMAKSITATTQPKQSPAISTKTPSVSDILENLRKVKEAEEKLKSAKLEKIAEEKEAPSKDMQPLTASEAITRMTGAPIVDFKERRRLRQQTKIEEERKELLAVAENALKDRKELQRRMAQNDSSQLGELLFCGSTAAMFDPNAPTMERVPTTRSPSQAKTRVVTPTVPKVEFNSPVAKLNETEQKTPAAAAAAAGGEGGVGNAASSVDTAKSIPELRVQTPTVKGDSSSITEGERKPSRKASSDSQATDASCDTFTLRTPCSGCNPLSFFAGAYPPTVGYCCPGTPMWGPCTHIQPPVLVQTPLAYAIPSYAQALSPWNYQPQLQWMPQLPPPPPPPQWNQMPVLTTEVLPQPQKLPTWPEPWPHEGRQKDVEISSSRSSRSSSPSSSTGLHTLRSHSSCSTSTSTSSSFFASSSPSSSTTSSGSGSSETSCCYDLV